MPHRKKEIKVEVHMSSKENIKDFQNRVNKILTEIIEIKIEKEEMETNQKNYILSKLESIYITKGIQKQPD